MVDAPCRTCHYASHLSKSQHEDHGQRWSRRAQSNTNSFTSSSSRHDGCSKDVQRTVRSKDLVRSLGGQCPSRFAPFLSLPMRILVIGPVLGETASHLRSNQKIHGIVMGFAGNLDIRKCNESYTIESS
jgi:hypothetical protein